MATIMRNGTKIELTPDEIHCIMQEEHRKDVAYEVECEVEMQEGEGWISFESWEESGQEYDSSSDARADFIERITADIIEREELYDNDPNGYHADVPDIVTDFARDMGYAKEAH